MPPLVVPTTQSSGSNPGSPAHSSRVAAMSMRLARCNRARGSVSGPSQASGTWPAVLARVRLTSNRSTSDTASRDSRSASRVADSPNPRGLRIPAAVMATRRGADMKKYNPGYIGLRPEEFQRRIRRKDPDPPSAVRSAGLASPGGSPMRAP